MNRDFMYSILKEGCESKEKGCEISNSLYIYIYFIILHVGIFAGVVVAKMMI